MIVIFEIIFGLLIGLLNKWSFGPVYLGEIFLIVYVFLFLYNKHSKIKCNVPILLLILLYSFYILSYYFYNIIYNGYILKYALKYIIILIEIIVFYNIKFEKLKKISIVLIGYLISSNVLSALEFSPSDFLHRIVHIIQIPLFVILFIQYKNMNNKSIIFLLILSFLASFIGVSRTNMIISLVLIIYSVAKLYIFNGKKTNKKLLIRNLSLLIISGVLLFNFVNYISDNLLNKTASNNERKLLIEIAQKEIKDNFLIGVGPANSTRYAMYNYGYMFKTDNIGIHNLFLEIFAETGVIGFFFLLYLYIYLYILIRKKYSFDVMLMYLYLILFYLFNTFSGTNRFCFSMLIGLILLKVDVRKNE